MPTAQTTRAARRVASEATDEARDVASSAAERGGALAQEAKQDARQLVGAVRERASDVTGELATQSRSVLQDATRQLQEQTGAGALRLANGFRELGEEAQALAEGRPQDAPRLEPYVYSAADALYGAAEGLYTLASDIENRGVGSVLGDLQDFARRRPGAFLLGAAAAGFGVARMVKAQKQAPRPEDDYGQPSYNGSSARGRR